MNNYQIKILLYVFALLSLPACGRASNDSCGAVVGDTLKGDSAKFVQTEEIEEEVEPLFMATYGGDSEGLVVSEVVPKYIRQDLRYAFIGSKLFDVSFDRIKGVGDSASVTTFMLRDSSVKTKFAEVALLVDSIFVAENQVVEFDVKNTPISEKEKNAITKEFEGKIVKSNTLISFDGDNSVSAVLLDLAPNVSELLLVYSKSGKPLSFAEYSMADGEGIDFFSMKFSSVLKRGKSDYSFIVYDNRARYFLCTNGDSIEEKLVCLRR